MVAQPLVPDTGSCERGVIAADPGIAHHVIVGAGEQADAAAAGNRLSQAPLVTIWLWLIGRWSLNELW